jgi:hypothetical protein
MVWFCIRPYRAGRLCVVQKGTFMLLLALGLSSAASAGDPLYFQTPSRNIGCMIWTGVDGAVRCDMKELKQSQSKRPADCDLDWGSAFQVNVGGLKGEVICHGDTVLTPDARVLDYGQSVDLSGFTCTSEKTGMTCVNESGHGFTLSKARQKLF